MDPLLLNSYRPEVVKLAAVYELTKTATGTMGHAAELAGLGILARPSIRKLRGKEQSEKSTHIHEAVGLGTLAAPSAIELGKKGLSALRKVKKAAVTPTGLGQLKGRAAGIVEGVAKKVVAPVGKAAPAPQGKKLTMDMIMAAKKRMAGGGSGVVG